MAKQSERGIGGNETAQLGLEINARRVSTFDLGDRAGLFYVETISAFDSADVRNPGTNADFEEVGFWDTLTSLKRGIGALGAAFKSVLAEAEPTEMSVELNVGLKGTANLVPILLNGSGEGSIKIVMKWKQVSGPIDNENGP